METSYTVLIAESDMITALLCKVMLQNLDMSFLGICTHRAQVQQFFAEEPAPDLFMLDAHLEGRHRGLAVHQQVQIQYNLPIILLADPSDTWVADYVRQHPRTSLLHKPISEEALQASFNGLVSRLAWK